jgi:hypothetical protein
MAAANTDQRRTIDTRYWASLPRDEIGAELLDRKDRYYRHMRDTGLFTRMRQAYQEYYGISSTQRWGGDVWFGGEQGEQVRLGANHLRSLTQHTLVMATGQRPAFDVRCINMDAKSQEQASIARGVLEYYLIEQRLEARLKKAAEIALVMGRGYVRTLWDQAAGKMVDHIDAASEPDEDGNPVETQPEVTVYEGDLKVDVLTPYDVIKPLTKDWNDCTWCMVRVPASRWDLAAQYPEFAEDILQQSTNYLDRETTLLTRTFTAEYEDDWVWLYEFYHLPTPALPEGRLVSFVSDRAVLLDGPLPYDRLPVYAIDPGSIFDTSDGYASCWDLMGVQRMADAILSAAATNYDAFAIQNIVVEEGTDLNPLEVAGGLNFLKVPRGTEHLPQGVNLTAMPPQFLDYYALLIKNAETLSGINSVARGDPQASLKSGAALALVQAMAVQYISGFQNSWNRLIEDVSTGVVGMLKRFAHTEKMVAIAGADKRFKMRFWTGADLEKVTRVVVDSGNPLSHILSGKVRLAEWFMELLKQGHPPEVFARVVQVLETGRLEPLTQSSQKELARIKEECEALVQGPAVKPLVDPITQMPAVDELTGAPLMEVENWPVLVTDQHMLCIQEKLSVLSTQESRNDPKVVAAVLTQINAHIRHLRTADPLILAATGQPLDMATGMPMGAGMGAGGPAGGKGAGPGADPASQTPGTPKMPKAPKNPMTGQPANIPTAGNGEPAHDSGE